MPLYLITSIDRFDRRYVDKTRLRASGSSRIDANRRSSSANMS